MRRLALLLGNVACCESATMTRVLATILAGLMLLCGTSHAHADWMFRRAYAAQSEHDHVPELPMRPSRTAYRPAETQRGPGFSFRGAYRLNVYRLQSGSSQDTTFFHEYRAEESAQ